MRSNTSFSKFLTFCDLLEKIKNYDKLATGYQIKYSNNKNFKKAKTVNTNKATATIKNLNRTKTYYVKVRAYKSNYYSVYSAKKSVTIKK